jgi:hypothetical protein
VSPCFAVEELKTDSKLTSQWGFSCKGLIYNRRFFGCKGLIYNPGLIQGIIALV